MTIIYTMSLLPNPNNGSPTLSYFVRNNGASDNTPVIPCDPKLDIGSEQGLAVTVVTGLSATNSVIYNDRNAGTLTVQACQASPAYIELSSTDGIVNGIAPRNQIYSAYVAGVVPDGTIVEVPNPTSPALVPGLYAVWADLTAAASAGSVSIVAYWNGTYWSGASTLPFGTGVVYIVPSVLNTGANLSFGNATGLALNPTIRFYQILGPLGA